jgi:hypothetical protein
MSVDVVFLRQHSVGTSQQGSCPRHREGYVDSISALTAERMALVGTLRRRNLDQHSLILVSTGLRHLVALARICRYGMYAADLVVGLLINTIQLLLVIRVRMKGSMVILADSVIALLTSLRHSQWQAWYQ